MRGASPPVPPIFHNRGLRPPTPQNVNTPQNPQNPQLTIKVIMRPNCLRSKCTHYQIAAIILLRPFVVLPEEEAEART